MQLRWRVMLVHFPLVPCTTWYPLYLLFAIQSMRLDVMIIGYYRLIVFDLVTPILSSTRTTTVVSWKYSAWQNEGYEHMQTSLG